MMTPVALTKILIEHHSVTPSDGDCFTYLVQLFDHPDISIEFFNQGAVKNLFVHWGKEGPLCVLLGHVDVVPPGPLDAWTYPPFSAIEKNGMLYGRGSADMKSAVAAMTCALLRFIKNAKQTMRVGLLLTSDEEGPAQDGVKYVLEQFRQRNRKIDYCLVGEPSSEKIFGDMIKIGRRGTLSGHLTLHGKQGHIAYPQLAINPIHQATSLLTELIQTIWDQGNAHFQPTALQFSNLLSGTGVGNMIPNSLTAEFNFRFSNESTAEDLQARFEDILKKHGLHYDLSWHLGGLPFLTTGGSLLEATQQSIQEVTKVTPAFSTQGGTSDGRFVAQTGAEVIEFGVINQTIHQIDECVQIADINLLSEIYFRILTKLENTHAAN